MTFDLSPVSPKICFVVASELTVKAFLIDHIVELRRAGFDVSVVAPSLNFHFPSGPGLSIKLHQIRIVRNILPWADLLALLLMIRLFRREGFKIVHTITPKAGLIGMLAGFLVRVPVRVHTFTGQVWATRRGLQRRVLKFSDRVISAMTTRTLVDSPSQLEFLAREGVIVRRKAEVIGIGGICGVDSSRFRPDPSRRALVRRDLAISSEVLVILFLGRLVRDKGVLDLAHAFCAVANQCEQVEIIFAGPDEENLANKIREIVSVYDDRVHIFEYTDFPEDLMIISDIFCMPSYREGFGMAIIEAAATGLPAVASKIYGITDAVVDGKTGLLYPPADVGALSLNILRLISNTDFRLKLGEQSRLRALNHFSKQEMSRHLLNFYKETLV
jgi:glycosyltransferase involved in cell wall biosynthesis